jgi:hypothetical protein
MLCVALSSNGWSRDPRCGLMPVQAPVSIACWVSPLFMSVDGDVGKGEPKCP